jgi:RNA polymerase sigma factor (sigma-70 family)
MGPMLEDELSHRLAEERFRGLYAEHGREILAYALRRLDDPEDAADVLAETFLVAWRRLAEVPSGSEARPWLYGVARNVSANQRRGLHRRERLGERLRGELSQAPIHPDDGPDAKVLDALERLDSADQEILRLTAWEELTPAEAAAALGISRIAARSRLHRARRRLRAELAVRPAPTVAARPKPTEER